MIDKYTVCYCPFDKDFRDEAGNARWISFGNPKIATGPEGRKGLYLDGSSLLQMPAAHRDAGLFAMGLDDFTVERWENRDRAAGTAFEVGSGGAASLLAGYSDDQVYPVIYAGNSSARWNALSNVQIGSTYATSGAIGKWMHRSVNRKGSTFYYTENGKLYGTTLNVTTSLNTAVYSPAIGARVDSTCYLKGYIADLRISRGITRYTGDHNIPQAPMNKKSSIIPALHSPSLLGK